MCEALEDENCFKKSRVYLNLKHMRNQLDFVFQLSETEFSANQRYKCS